MDFDKNEKYLEILFVGRFNYCLSLLGPFQGCGPNLSESRYFPLKLYKLHDILKLMNYQRIEINDLIKNLFVKTSW